MFFRQDTSPFGSAVCSYVWDKNIEKLLWHMDLNIGILSKTMIQSIVSTTISYVNHTFIWFIYKRQIEINTEQAVNYSKIDSLAFTPIVLDILMTINLTIQEEE